MKRIAFFLLVVLVLGCAEGQKPNPLPRAKEDKQNLPVAIPAEQRDQLP
jgi:hypothetical protein